MALRLEERLRISLEDRARAFGERIEREIARVGNTGPGVTHALQLFGCYAGALGRQVRQSWEDSPNPKFKVASMRMLNQHLRTRVELFDSRFSRGHMAVPSALAATIEQECKQHGLDKREAVLTVGPPGNFTTFIADLQSFLFRQIQVDPAFPDHLVDSHLVMIAMPDSEGTRAAWQPIVVGHELAHYIQTANPVITRVGLETVLDKGELAATKDPLPPSLAATTSRSRALEQIAMRWLNELICDAYAVHRMGAAGLASLAEFLESVAASTVVSASHPPARLRTQMMFEWLGSDMTEVDAEIAEPLRELAGSVTKPDWAVYLTIVMSSLTSKIKEVVADWAGTPAYTQRARQSVVSELADRIADGIPGAESVAIHSEFVEVEPVDIINASWLAIHRGTTTPVNRLTLKALDTLAFLHQWRSAEGEKLREAPLAPASAAPGALTASEIAERLSRTDQRRLVVTPLLPGSVKGASVDLRTGNKFIVFERSTAAAFDALDPAQDPRSMQSSIERAWGDVLFLHPGQLVLASTLEYISMPGDLTAQVITRSSYGRLGLISATAVQVHPYFAGCLTLELANLGEIPMAITPGERIAQLMLFTTTSPAAEPESGDKYRFPTGPEFSKVREDRETEVLRNMRRRFDERVGRRSL